MTRLVLSKYRTEEVFTQTKRGKMIPITLVSSSPGIDNNALIKILRPVTENRFQQLVIDIKDIVSWHEQYLAHKPDHIIGELLLQHRLISSNDCLPGNMSADAVYEFLEITNRTHQYRGAIIAGVPETSQQIQCLRNKFSDLKIVHVACTVEYATRKLCGKSPTIGQIQGLRKKFRFYNTEILHRLIEIRAVNHSQVLLVPAEMRADNKVRNILEFMDISEVHKNTTIGKISGNAGKTFAMLTAGPYNLTIARHDFTGLSYGVM